MEFFGDSYDVVKRFLLRTLAPSGDWIALPMYTHEVQPSEVAAFQSFLGVRVHRSEPMAPRTDRSQAFDPHPAERYVFVDPDTGIRLKPTRGANAVKYVFAAELVALAKANPDRLLLVFDQSVPRGSEEAAIAEKLGHFKEQDVSCFSYLSHACFVVLSANPANCNTALSALQATYLPSNRIVQ